MANLNIINRIANSDSQPQGIQTVFRPREGGGGSGTDTLDVLITALSISGTVLTPDRDISDARVKINFFWTEPIVGWNPLHANVDWVGATGQVVRITTGGTAEARAFFAMYLDIPINSQGSVRITVPANSGRADRDANLTGPPVDRTLILNFNTQHTTITTPVVDVINCDEVVTTAKHTFLILWSEDVEDFSENDMSISVGTLGNLQSINARSYTVEWTLPVSSYGTATLIINQESANGRDRSGPSTQYQCSIVYDTALATIIYCGDGSAATVVATHDRTWVQEKGGYLGVLELLPVGTALYLVVQKKKGSGNVRLIDEERGTAELLRVSSGSFGSIEKYDDVLVAPRSLCVYDSKLHFFRGSQYLYEELDAETDDWREVAGGIYEMSASAPSLIAHAGRSRLTDPVPISNDHAFDYYYSNFGGMASPMLVDGNDLYFVAGFGNQDSQGKVALAFPDTEPESDIENWLLNIRSTTLKYQIPILESNDRTAFEIITDVARVSSSAFGFSPTGQFYYKPNEPVSAELNADISATATSLAIKNTSHVTGYPSGGGHIWIDGEVMSYTGISSGTVTGLKRGLNGSTASAHTANDKIYWINHLAGYQTAIRLLSDHLNIRVDNSNIYKKVEVLYDGQTYSAGDGTRSFRITVPIGKDQAVLAKHIGDTYLEQLKEPREIMRFRCQIETGIDVGQTIFIREPKRASLSHIVFVTEVQHTQSDDTTEVVGIKI